MSVKHRTYQEEKTSDARLEACNCNTCVKVQASDEDAEYAGNADVSDRKGQVSENNSSISTRSVVKKLNMFYLRRTFHSLPDST